MVTTRSKATAEVPRDDNRVIAVVTGANSGYGLGICHQLLSQLSLPAGYPIPGSTPQPTALAPSMRHLLQGGSGPTKKVPPSPPPTLTLVLATRSESKAAVAEQEIRARHDKEIQRRRREGMQVREGWMEGLRIVWEGVDFDAMDGEIGVFAFCERMKARYPHITTLYLNAGGGAFTGLYYWPLVKQIFTDGYGYTVAHPIFNRERKGARSADGERARIWGLNVLSGYVLAKELHPLLQLSPRGLPFSPRIIYTGSCSAALDRLQAQPLQDPQLLTYGSVLDEGHSNYQASKYVGELVMVQLDRQLGSNDHSNIRSVRVLVADPGCTATNTYNEGFGSWLWLQKLMWLGYWISFYLARLCGSPWHILYASTGALSMLYAALISETYILPPGKLPGPRFNIHAYRWGASTIDYAEVDRWEEAEYIAEGEARLCEEVRLDWRRRLNLE